VIRGRQASETMSESSTARLATPASSHKAIALSGLLLVQTGCAAFFTLDVIADLGGLNLLSDGPIHHVIELIAVVVLVLGIALTARRIRHIRSRQRRVEAQLRVASGAFHDLLEESFDAWALTPSERDVALLSIKGLPIADIARIRQTKEGTIKAQSNAIYAKAGVSGRQQLLSLFIEELMNDRLVPDVSAD